MRIAIKNIYVKTVEKTDAFSPPFWYGALMRTAITRHCQDLYENSFAHSDQKEHSVIESLWQTAFPCFTYLSLRHGVLWDTKRVKKCAGSAFWTRPFSFLLVALQITHFMACLRCTMHIPHIQPSFLPSPRYFFFMKA